MSHSYEPSRGKPAQHADVALSKSGKDEACSASIDNCSLQAPHKSDVLLLPSHMPPLCCLEMQRGCWSFALPMDEGWVDS